MASEQQTSDSLVSRVQTLIADNRRTILIGTVALAVAVGGVGYYAYSTRSRTEYDDEDGAEKGDAERRRKKKALKKRKSMKDDDGPLLEERREVTVEDVERPKLTKAEIEALPIEERIPLAASLKTKGNQAYQQRDFAAAVDHYTQAIDISPKPEAVFYSNRAACYVQFSPPRYDLVIADCDEALKLDPGYVKALNRRATALDALGRDEEALRDYTAATILDKFQNDQTSAALERVLKKISQRKTAEILKSREPRLPSYTFISAYISAFRPRALPVLPAEPSPGDQTLLLALEALQAMDYPHAFSLANEAVDQDISFDAGRAEAFNLRGTFRFLTGDSIGAREDFQKSIEIFPSLTQTWVKIASVHMELGDDKAAFAAFNSAIAQNPDDPDIYYHRGQVNFIMRQFKEAEEDYAKSTSLDPTFVFSHIQLAVAQYKNEQLASSMATFRRTMKAFPDKSEPLNYYGELLLDQQRYQEAVEKFDKALDIEKQRKPMNVLPLVNKALALYQWQNDLPRAEELCKEALEIDPECDAAVATLAQLSLQQGKLDQAIEYFGRHASIARSEPELEQSVTFENATRAQKEFLQAYPHMASQLGALARSLS